MVVKPSRSFVLGAMVLSAPLWLGGCSSAGAVTCEEFSAQDIATQADTLSDLLREHDLQPNDPGNIQGINQAVGNLCGGNSSAVLENATDWDAATW